MSKVGVCKHRGKQGSLLSRLPAVSAPLLAPLRLLQGWRLSLASLRLCPSRPTCRESAVTSLSATRLLLLLPLLLPPLLPRRWIGS